MAAQSYKARKTGPARRLGVLSRCLVLIWLVFFGIVVAANAADSAFGGLPVQTNSARFSAFPGVLPQAFWANLDGDSVPDFVQPSIAGDSVGITFSQRQPGHLRLEHPGFQESVIIHDIDRDGDLDLIAFDLNKAAPIVWRNDGRGQFERTSLHHTLTTDKVIVDHARSLMAIPALRHLPSEVYGIAAAQADIPHPAYLFARARDALPPSTTPRLADCLTTCLRRRGPPQTLSFLLA